MRTKLIPAPIRTNLVDRPALHKRMQAALSHKLTLVSAPAGFGKTTTVSVWFANLDLPAAWITLDKDDNDAGLFLAYVIAALENLQVTKSETEHNFFSIDEVGSSTSTLKELLNAISIFDKQAVLVLEDYHLIQEQSVHRAVIFLLDHLPPNFHLVILTRSDPPFPLSRMRGRGEINELRSSDLRFSNLEVRRYLTKISQLSLTNEQIQVLTYQTDGWIVGLQMAGLSLQGKREIETNSFIQNLASNQAYVLDYLADEVLNQQPEHIQDFLLQTAILDRLTGDLCDTLTGQSGGSELLKVLHRGNMFLFPLDDDTWYRYHPLFADLLRNRLRVRGKTPLVELHQRASDWYMRKGMVDGAINHALAASDYERAVPLIEKHALDTIFRGEFVKIQGWMQALPGDVVLTKPLLCLAFSWASLRPETLSEAETLIQAAVDNSELRASGDCHDPNKQQKLIETIKSHAATLRAIISRARDETPDIQLKLTNYALDTVPKDDLALRSVLALRLGLCYLDQGDEKQAEHYFRQAVESGKISENHYALTTAYYCLTMIALRAGALHKAASLCRESIQVAKKTSSQGKPLPMNGIPYIMLGTILLEWNDLSQAEDYLIEGLALLDLVGMYQDAEIKLKGVYSLARLQIAQGEFQSLPDLNSIGIQGKPFLNTLASGMQTMLEVRAAANRTDRDMLLARAAEWAERHLIEPKEDLYWDWEMIKDFAYLRSRITQQRMSGLGFSGNEFDKLISRLKQILEVAGQRNWLSMILEANILMAMILQMNSKTDRALAALGNAMEIAVIHGHIRIFLDEGQPMAKLLYEAVEKGIQAHYAAKLIDKMQLIEKIQQPESAHTIEPLTRREIDVLELLAEGLSNKEIGRRLSISMGTVKRHTANINGKLGVNNRTEAVVRALKLGVLPDDFIS